MDDEAKCSSKIIYWIGKGQAGLTKALFFSTILVIIFLPFVIFLLLTGNFLIGLVPTIITLVAVVAIIQQYKEQWAYDAINAKNNFPEFQSNGPHHAIIITHRDLPKTDGTFPNDDYLDGMDILIENFRLHSLAYKVYDVEFKDKLIPLIRDSNTTHLWIFGHGKRNSVSLKDGNLCYYYVSDVDKKTFKGQYHCNSFFGKSLADYNNPDFQDVTHNARLTPFIRRSIRKKLKEMGI